MLAGHARSFPSIRLPLAALIVASADRGRRREEEWARVDSNHCRPKPTGLQPAPFGRSGTRPSEIHKFLAVAEALASLASKEDGTTDEGADEEEHRRHRSPRERRRSRARPRRARFLGRVAFR